MIKVFDRIKELSTTTDVGTFKLEGAAFGYSAFNTYYNSGELCYYAAVQDNLYEVGSGEYYFDGSYGWLTRNAIQSTNANNLVSFGHGVKEVFVTYPAKHAVYSEGVIPSGSVAIWSGPNSLSSTDNVVLKNVANVFTAKQSFSGIDHAGLQLNSLTTAQYNALTPANGDIYRDSTTDRIGARLARGTVELIDSAGGQTISGVLNVRRISAIDGLYAGSNVSQIEVGTTDNAGRGVFGFQGSSWNTVGIWGPGRSLIGNPTIGFTNAATTFAGAISHYSSSINLQGRLDLGTAPAILLNGGSGVMPVVRIAGYASQTAPYLECRTSDGLSQFSVSPGGNVTASGIAPSLNVINTGVGDPNMTLVTVSANTRNVFRAKANGYGGESSLFNFGSLTNGMSLLTAHVAGQTNIFNTVGSTALSMDAAGNRMKFGYYYNEYPGVHVFNGLGVGDGAITCGNLTASGTITASAIILNSISTGTAPLIINGIAGQANLQQWKNHLGTVVGQITNAGAMQAESFLITNNGNFSISRSNNTLRFNTFDRFEFLMGNGAGPTIIDNLGNLRSPNNITASGTVNTPAFGPNSEIVMAYGWDGAYASFTQSVRRASGGNATYETVTTAAGGLSRTSHIGNSANWNIVLGGNASFNVTNGLDSLISSYINGATVRRVGLVSANTPGVACTIGTPDASQVTLRLNQFATTPGNFIECRTSTPTTVFSVDAAGNLTANGTVTLSDANGILQFINSAMVLRKSGSSLLLENGNSGHPLDLSASGPVNIVSAQGVPACLGFSSTRANITPPTRISQASAGVLQIGTTSNNALGSLNLTNLTASGSGVFGNFVTVNGTLSNYSFLSANAGSVSSNTWRFGHGWAGNYDTQFIFAYADNAAKVTIDSTGAITAFGGYYVNVPASSSNNIRPLQHGNSFLRFSAPASGIPGNNTTVTGWDSVILDATTGVIRNRIGGADRLVLTNTDLTLTGNLIATGNITTSGTVTANQVFVGGSGGARLHNNGAGTIEVFQNNGVTLGTLTAGACRTNAIQRDIGDVSLVLYNSNFSVAGFCIRGPNGSYLNSSGITGTLHLNPTINQTGTAGSTDFLINRTETALGSGVHNFADFQVGGSSRWRVDRLGDMYFHDGVNYTLISKAPGANGRLRIFRPNSSGALAVQFGGGNDEITVGQGGEGSFKVTGANVQVGSSGPLLIDSSTNSFTFRGSASTTMATLMGVGNLTTVGSITASGNIATSGNITLNSGASIISGSGGVGTLNINNDGNSRWQFVDGEFVAAGQIRPSSNGLRQLGTTSNRWSTVFAVSGDYSELVASTLIAFDNFGQNPVLRRNGSANAVQITRRDTSALFLGLECGNIISAGTGTFAGNLTAVGNVTVSGTYLYGDTTTPFVRLSNTNGARIGYTGGNSINCGGPIQILDSAGTERVRFQTGNGWMGVSTNSPLAPVHSVASLTSSPAFIAQGMAGQTASVFEVRNSGSIVVAAITDAGLLDLRKTATANILQFSTNAFLRTDTSQLSIFDTGIGRNNISLWRGGNFVIGSSALIAACSNLDSTGGSVDTSLSRASAGVWQIGNGTANALGSLNLANLTASVQIDTGLIIGTNNTGFACHASLGVAIASTMRFGVTSGSNPQVTPDVTLSRASAGVWQMGTTANNALGSLNLANLNATGTVTASSISASTFVPPASLTSLGVNCFISGNVSLATGTLLTFSSTADPNGTRDWSLSRASSGVAQIGNGTANALGSLNLTNLTASGTITASSTGTHTFGTTNTVTITAGAISASQGTGNPTLNIANPGNSGPDACARIGTASAGLWVAGANYGVRATAGNAATVPFTARGFASQTANLQEWQNSAGTVLASISPAGNLTATGTVTAVTLTSTAGNVYLADTRWSRRAAGVVLLDGFTGVANILMGGLTSDFPAIKRNATAINIRLADDSADAPLTCSNLTASGKITGPASTTALAPLNLPHGVAPTSPVNGDIWTTTSGVFVRVNGATTGPFVESFFEHTAEGLNAFSVTKDPEGVASLYFQSESSTTNAWPPAVLSVDSETGHLLRHGTSQLQITSDDGIYLATSGNINLQASAYSVTNQAAFRTAIQAQQIITSGTPLTCGNLTAVGNITASGNVVQVPPSSVALTTNGQFAVEMTSNTDGNFAYRGSDGVTRRTSFTFGTNPTAIPASVVYVDSPADLPAASGGVHTLAAGSTYIIAGTVDLAGNRIVCGDNTTIIGAGSSENCRLKSTGLTGTALITSAYSLPMRSLTIEADTALNLNAIGTPTAALDWYGVNFNTCGTVGTIANYSNFIATDCAWLSSGAMTFDGTIGTIGFSQCIFTPAATKTALIVAATATITRRFRVIYSAFVATSGMTGINFNASATVPDEGYILDTVNFGGGGTYTTGVAQTSDKCRWVACVGVTNTVAIAQMYMKNNATATDVITQNARYPMAGTTEFAALSQRFEHVLADNAVRYTSSVPRRVKVLVSFSLEAANNNVISVCIGKCAAGNSIVPDTDRISESEVYVTTTGTRPDSGFVQALIDIAENDKVYIIVQNTTTNSDVTVKFMHMIIEQAVS